MHWSTSIDSFGAIPNPSPANVGISFSWYAFGRDLICTLDVEGDGTIDYTVQNCSSQSHIVHTYGTQGAFDDTPDPPSLFPERLIAVGPLTRLTGSKTIAVSAGYEHGCLMRDDGNIWCWGDNTYGAVGDNSTTQRNAPVAVTFP